MKFSGAVAIASLSALIPNTGWSAVGTGSAAGLPSTSTQAGNQPGIMPNQPSTQAGLPSTTQPGVNNNQQAGIAGGLNENTNITSPGVAPEANPAPTITAGPGAGALGVPPGTFGQGPSSASNGSNTTTGTTANP